MAGEVLDVVEGDALLSLAWLFRTSERTSLELGVFGTAGESDFDGGSGDDRTILGYGVNLTLRFSPGRSQVDLARRYD